MSSTNATLTYQEKYVNSLISYYLYMAVGGIAITANAIIIIVFCSAHYLRVKYPLLTALAIANLINGAGFVLAGAIKRQIFLTIQTTVAIWTSWDCAMEPYPALLIFGAQWPACITLILGVERYAAVHLPVWYKMNINAKARFKLVAASLLFSLFSLGIAYSQAYIFFRNSTTIFLCQISGAFGKYYTTWNYILTIFGHLIAFVLNASAYLSAKSKSRIISSGLSVTIKKEITLVRLMLGLSLLSVILISIPNIILWGQSWVWSTNGNVLGYIYVSFCASSAINIFIYFFFNKDFCAQLLHLINCDVLTKVRASAVQPLTTQNDPKNVRASFVSRNDSVIPNSLSQISRNATAALVSIYD